MYDNLPVVLVVILCVHSQFDSVESVNYDPKCNLLR